MNAHCLYRFPSVVALWLIGRCAVGQSELHADPTWSRLVNCLPFGVMETPNLPSESELTSNDPLIAEAAWSRAYAILWTEGMRIASARMGSADEKDREDVVSRAIQDLQRCLYRRVQDGKELD